MLRYLLIIIATTFTSVLYAQQDSLTLRLSKSELQNYLEYKRTTNQYNINNESDSIDIDSEKSYRNLILFKQKKGKGYGKQPFEDKAKYAFLQKNVSFAAFSLGFSSNDMDEYLLEPIAEIETLKYTNYSGTVSAGHFIANNTALVGKFSYSFTETKLRVSADILDILIGAGTYETNYVNSTYSGAIGVRNFVPLGTSQRLFIVSETNIGYSYVESLSKNYYDTDVKVTKVSKVKDIVGIGLSPGFMYFMSRGFAFEFAMNPVMAYWQREETINNESSYGSVNNYGLSFKFMPFNIQFGFSYYFGLDFDTHRRYLKRMNVY